MELKVWDLGGKMGVDNGHFIQAVDIILPQGFSIAEQSVVGVIVNRSFDIVEPTILLVSDPRWSDATTTTKSQIPWAFNYAGEKEKVQQMIEDLLKEWEDATQKKAYIQIRINESLKDAFFTKCEKNFQTPSVVLRGLIEKFVEGE